MGAKPLRTVDVARAAGIHPNTVRLYVEWGYLAPPERAVNGYRAWTAEHADQAAFAVRALRGFWPGRRIRASAIALVKLAAAGDLGAALAAARAHEALVADEKARAEEAADALERWASLPPPRKKVSGKLVGRKEAAREIGATEGQLRNWERNRLIDPPRDWSTGHRAYGAEDLDRARVVRTLLLAGYSVMAVLRMATALDSGRPADLRKVLTTPRKDEEVLTAFDAWLSFLDGQAARARELTAMLERRAAGAGADA